VSSTHARETLAAAHVVAQTLHAVPPVLLLGWAALTALLFRCLQEALPCQLMLLLACCCTRRSGSLAPSAAAAVAAGLFCRWGRLRPP
jgi:branched-subunit amino acid transport protein AzlD